MKDQDESSKPSNSFAGFRSSVKRRVDEILAVTEDYSLFSFEGSYRSSEAESVSDSSHDSESGSETGSGSDSGSSGSDHSSCSSSSCDSSTYYDDQESDLILQTDIEIPTSPAVDNKIVVRLPSSEKERALTESTFVDVALGGPSAEHNFKHLSTRNRRICMLSTLILLAGAAVFFFLLRSGGLQMNG